MTALTPERIDEIERGCEGVTAGPWHAEPKVGRGAWIKGAAEEWTAVACGFDGTSAAANAAHIARCDPDTIRALIAAARANAKLVEALTDIANTFDHTWRRGSLELRIGDQARAALEAAGVKP